MWPNEEEESGWLGMLGSKPGPDDPRFWNGDMDVSFWVMVAFILAVFLTLLVLVWATLGI